MAQRETGKRAYEGHNVDSAADKAVCYQTPRGQVQLNAQLSHEVKGVTDIHHERECEQLRLKLVMVRIELTELADRMAHGGGAGPEICNAWADEVHGSLSTLSGAFNILATIRNQQHEDVRRVLWGDFETYSRNEQAVRLHHLLVLWTGKKFRVAFAVDFRVEDPKTENIMALISPDGKLHQHGVVRVDFSAPYESWGPFGGL